MSRSPIDPMFALFGHAPQGTMRMLGPVLLMQMDAGAAVADATRGSVAPVDALVLLLPAPRRPDESHSVGDGGLLFDLRTHGAAIAGAGGGHLLVLPRRLVVTLIAGRIAARPVPETPALGMIRRLVAQLADTADLLDERQAELVGKALCELISVALRPLAADSVAKASPREATLLDRVVAHVDAHIAEPLDAAALCSALNCSRSSLYRAVTPLGGVGALVGDRRLLVAHGRVTGDAGSIASIAAACGFPDASSFSRSFKRRFGTTAARLRRDRRAPAGSEGRA